MPHPNQNKDKDKGFNQGKALRRLSKRLLKNLGTVNPQQFAQQMYQASAKPLRSEYRQYGNQMDNIYGAVSAAMPAIQQAYKTGAEGANQMYQDAMGNIASLVGGLGGPGNELAAAAGYFGNMGGAGAGLMSQGYGRNLGYGASSSRQAVLDQAEAKANALIEMQQALDALRAQMPEWMMQGREYNLALAEYLLRNKALQGQLKGYNAANEYMAAGLKGGKNGGKGNNGGGGNALKSWASGDVKWGQLTNQQRGAIRDQLREDPSVIKRWANVQGLGHMSVQEIIKYINSLGGGGNTPDWSPGSQGGPQY